MGYGQKGLKDWAEEIHGIAKEKGWHDEPMTERAGVAVYFLNIIAEATEAWEAFRAGKLNELCDKADKMRALNQKPLTCAEEELADIVIRAFDTAEKLGIDIEGAIRSKSEYNRSRSHRHGGKRA